MTATASLFVAEKRHSAGVKTLLAKATEYSTPSTIIESTAPRLLSLASVSTIKGEL